MKTFQTVLVFGLMLGLITTETIYPYALVYAEENLNLPEEVQSEVQTEEVQTTEDTETTSMLDAGEPVLPVLAQDEGSGNEDSEIEEIEPSVVDPLATSSVTLSFATSTQDVTTKQNGTTTLVVDQLADSDEDFVDEMLATTSLGSTTIVSGQAVALANVLNLVNTNFVNSDGVVLFSNFFDTVLGAIDFRSYFDTVMDYGCSLISCQGHDVVVNVENDASIDNHISLVAQTGNNIITTATDANIQTGDAYAGVNLINIANTNLVDSNYLLVTLNAFKNVDGDVVFPSLSDFFGTLAQGGTAPEVIDIVNTATVNNNVFVDANSGDNQSTDNQSGLIQTGEAKTSSNVFNQLNSSLVGGQSVSIVFKVHGKWAGEIYGAPDDLGWSVGDDGSIYLFDVGQNSQNGSLSLFGTSTSQIHNNVSVVALTGENAITDAETAVISTGNAYAGANIINVANANVIGRNWILAVINIFGDFNGNIAFGRPDLWVGGQVDIPKTIQNGSELTYNFTVINNGDSPATSVDFTSKVDGQYLEIIDASQPYVLNENADMQWKIATIPAGGAVEISYRARVRNSDEGRDIISTAVAVQRETDQNVSDNTETLTVTTSQKGGGNGIRISLQSNSAMKVAMDEKQITQVPLEVVRKIPETIMNGTANTVEEKLIVSNTTNETAHNVVLHDILSDPSGNLVRDEVWELGSVLAGEEIEIGYVITFNENAPFGTYTLGTTIQGSNTALDTKNNGTISYGDSAMVLENPNYVFDISNTEDTSFETAVSTKVQDSPDVRVQSSPFAVATAFASGDTSLSASAFGSAFSFDPILSLLAFISALLAVSLLRFIRW